MQPQAGLVLLLLLLLLGCEGFMMYCVEVTVSLMASESHHFSFPT